MKKSISALLCFAIMLSLCFGVSAVYSEDQMIKSIAPGTTVSELKTLLSSVQSVSTGTIPLTANTAVGTGNSITCTSGVFKAVVLGDVDGDGAVTSRDYLRIKRYYMGIFTLSGEYLLAADTDEDSVIRPYDYLAVKRHVLGNYDIGSDENAVKISVLLYHHILPDADKASGQWPSNDITISTSEFRHHMQLIKDQGYTVVTTEELIGYIKGERTLPEKSVVLQFDDGYKSNTEYAAPILRQFRYQATLFSIMEPYLGSYEPTYYTNSLQHVTQKDLSMNKDVFTQQCHTYANHEHLDTQSYTYVYNDLMKSQNAYPCEYFAYPYGDFDADVIRAVKAAGLKAAFTIVENDVIVGTDLYEIPRYMVTTPMGDTEFLELLN